MNIFNAVFSAIFNMLFYPFNSLAPVWGMLIISFVTGVVMLFIFKATSDQKGIKQAKNFVKAHFLAIRLYRDDIGLMFNTMKNILVSNMLYMKKSLRPMLFLIVPVGVILIQLGSRYEFRPFKVGETFILTLRLHEAIENVDLKDVGISLPVGLSLDMPPVKIARLREVNWRVKAEQPGSYDVVFKYQGSTVNKQLHVEGALVPIAREIARSNLSVALMNPAESSLPGSSFASIISVGYPKRDFEFFGWQFHWLIAFFIFSLISAFAFKGFLGVEV